MLNRIFSIYFEEKTKIPNENIKKGNLFPRNEERKKRKIQEHKVMDMAIAVMATWPHNNDVPIWYGEGTWHSWAQHCGMVWGAPTFQIEFEFFFLNFVYFTLTAWLVWPRKNSENCVTYWIYLKTNSLADKKKNAKQSKLFAPSLLLFRILFLMDKTSQKVYKLYSLL